MTQSWLIVGDGDLSYAASVAPTLDPAKILLHASVWEDCPTHRDVYRNSAVNTQMIQQAGHEVHFGIDATQLKEATTTCKTTLPTDQRFDRIMFNFPHWRGKANHRYNRQLIDQFLASATQVLHPVQGQVCIALLDGQSGLHAANVQAWKQSWMVPAAAAQHGLMLQDVQPFVVDYNLSSHRGVDRAFSPGQSPRQYTFAWPSSNDHDKPIPANYQMACRHELRLRLDPNRLDKNCPYAAEELIHSDIIPSLVRSCVPAGIHVELPLRDVIHGKKESSSAAPLLVFLVVYAGSCQPLTRDLGNTIRAAVEDKMRNTLHLDIAKPGRSVSKVFPYALLDGLLQEYHINQLVNTTAMISQ